MSPILAAFGLVGASLLLLKVYSKLTCGMYKIVQDLTGKVILITGASSGIGKEAALELAKHGARLYLPVRNLQKGKEVADEIKALSGSQQVFLLECDFSSLESVRKCAAAFRAKEKRLDILVNNAGMWPPSGQQPKITADGLELAMASNHFGSFLFTSLLVDVLKASAPSRIVNTSSRGHIRARFDINNPPTYIRGPYEEGREYEVSKFANVLFTRQLARRLHGTGVTANCLHPGVVGTSLLRPGVSAIYKYTIAILMPFIGKTPVEGCQTILYCALAPELEHVSGHYFADCKPKAPNLEALNDELAVAFWKASEEVTH